MIEIYLRACLTRSRDHVLLPKTRFDHSFMERVSLTECAVTQPKYLHFSE